MVLTEGDFVKAFDYRILIFLEQLQKNVVAMIYVFASTWDTIAEVLLYNCWVLTGALKIQSSHIEVFDRTAQYTINPEAPDPYSPSCTIRADLCT